MIINLIDTLPGNQYRSRSLMGLKYVVVHHSASNNDTPASINDYHRGKGWPRIGYHFVIDREGQIYKTNPVDRTSYHCKGYNTVSIGICVLGDFETTEPGIDQMNRLTWLLNRLLDSPLLPHLEIKGHRDLGNTLCPGSNLYYHLFGR